AELDGAVYAGIEKELDRVLRGEEAIWYDPKTAGISIEELFEPFPAERPEEGQIPTIAAALSGNIDKTRESGHNVIFAAIALRALHDHPEYATPSVIEGICKLIEGFDDVGPGRGYYGQQRQWVLGENVSLPADDPFPPYEDELEMVEVVIDELIQTAATRRQGFGGLWHVINHAAALIELSRFDYKDLARKGLAGHRHHVRLWRSLPDVEQELGPVKQARYDPRTAKYWTTDPLKRDSARLTHRIKTMYGFFTLDRYLEDEAKRKVATEKLLYLM
ncbi:MAG: hypothetical protein OES79_11455, partial [Planctomycetota bacterium]|nr:hypothetical protein [Planctomycetota bacterium]